MNRQELESMFGIDDLRKTRSAQELMEEAKAEGKAEGEIKGKLKAIPR